MLRIPFPPGSEKKLLQEVAFRHRYLEVEVVVAPEQEVDEAKDETKIHVVAAENEASNSVPIYRRDEPEATKNEALHQRARFGTIEVEGEQDRGLEIESRVARRKKKNVSILCIVD